MNNVKHASWIKGHCPACGHASLFRTFLEMHDACPACGWKIAGRDLGDAAVYISILIIGIVVGGWSVWLEMRYAPPLWVHAASAIPMTLILCLLLLRCCRAFFIHSAYAQKHHDL